MANRVPFKAYFKIVPNRGSGKRFEIHRSREQISNRVWNDLNDTLEDSMNEPTDAGTSSMMNFAVPGGGVQWSLAEDTGSKLMNGVALKPQFGEFPETLTVVGFYDSDNVVPYREKQLISAGRTWTGPATGAPGYSDNTEPSDGNRADAVALKAALEAAITSVSVEVIRLEVCGVAYGHGGFHFPQ